MLTLLERERERGPATAKKNGEARLLDTTREAVLYRVSSTCPIAEINRAGGVSSIPAGMRGFGNWYPRFLPQRVTARPR